MRTQLLSVLFIQTWLWIGAVQSIAQVPNPDPEVKKAETWVVNGYMQERGGNKAKAQKYYLEAVKIYKRAIKNTPATAELWKNLGLAHWFNHNKKESLAAYRESVRLNPNDAESHCMLGFLQGNNLEAEIDAYREAARINPANSSYRVELARALAKKNDAKAAIAEMEEAIRLNPRHAENHAVLGGIWLEAGNIDKAISEYRKAAFLRKPVKESSSFLDMFAQEKRIAEVEDLNYWIQRAEDWKLAATLHKPGALDGAAVKIGSWPVGDLEAILSIVTELAEKKMPHSHQIPNSLLRCYIEFRKSFEDKLKAGKNFSPLLKEGVLLHTDIALLRLETGSDDEPDSQISLVHDGIGITTGEGMHWFFARSLLNALTADPSNDGIVKRWYVATTANMLRSRDRIHADQNLKQALEIFPNDPMLLFYAGALHESYASPKSQNAIPPSGTQFLYKNRKKELELARQYLDNSIQANPDFHEAHLRLGRILGLSGDHKSAIKELQKADAAPVNSKLQYYASLFLGIEFASLGQNDKARESFHRASNLFPAAQAPLLAASLLARSSGDFDSSLEYLQKVFSLPQDVQQNDPWWEYETEYVQDSEAFLAGMRKDFRIEP
jgi:tetratricopeptide (TPR) repeat protein